ncbi:uncharacterized protein STEHIDRAFT_115846 [Stereum hirsutum FP-91666 SS1]|uniref:Uncharacterized protein n=1 Tax=Stereum hirsutum (strain FP-91666) TaxID=721885 RepID=R7RZR3_STEHR|nr:uncharacterized protein STEHIDRAFT_115846 [Stereum hirsutum FP-91666 SS1]EIM80395.1 hypothetical protein STEHIDRAFT_115846 [Stereum hirsutum FP-91666 SS1]
MGSSQAKQNRDIWTRTIKAEGCTIPSRSILGIALAGKTGSEKQDEQARVRGDVCDYASSEPSLVPWDRDSCDLVVRRDVVARKGGIWQYSGIAVENRGMGASQVHESNLEKILGIKSMLIAVAAEKTAQANRSGRSLETLKFWVPQGEMYRQHRATAWERMVMHMAYRPPRHQGCLKQWEWERVAVAAGFGDNYFIVTRFDGVEYC